MTGTLTLTVSREAAGEELGGRREGAREAGGNRAGEVITAETGEGGGQNSGGAAQPDEEMMRSEVSGLNSLSQSQRVTSTVSVLGIVETTHTTATPPQSVAETVVSESVAGQLNGEPPAMMSLEPHQPHPPLRRQLSDDPQTK